MASGKRKTPRRPRRTLSGRPPRRLPAATAVGAIPFPYPSATSQRRLVAMARDRLPLIRAEIEFWLTVLARPDGT